MAELEPFSDLDSDRGIRREGPEAGGSFQRAQRTIATFQMIARSAGKRRNIATTGKQVSNVMPVASPTFASAGQSNGDISPAGFEVQSDGSCETVH